MPVMALRGIIALLLLAVLCGAMAGSSPGLKASDLLTDARSFAPWIVSVRRELHAIPELLFQEERTSAAVRAHLKVRQLRQIDIQTRSCRQHSHTS
jgi:hypothetical protein